MTELTQEITVGQTVALLSRYGFELRGHTAEELIGQWLKEYQAKWIRLAVVEALYQGRYKAISVEQILKFWWRRGQPTFHFTHEFERLISRKIPRPLSNPSAISENSEAEDEEFLHWRSLEMIETSVQELENTSEISGAETSRDTEIDVDKLAIATDKVSPPRSWSHNKLNSSDNLPFPPAQFPSSPIADSTDGSPVSPSERRIHEFTPLLDSSEFYAKLRAVIKQG
jgi:hypothetical protein